MRRVTILAAVGAALVALGGCGFTPLYADPQANFIPLRDITIEPRGRERVDFMFEQAMADKLGAHTPSGAYRLEAVVTEGRQGFGIRVDNVATRYESTVIAWYRLIRTSDGAVLTRGSRAGVASYDVSDDPYSELTAEQKSIERAVELAAEKVRLDLTLYFAGADAEES